MEYLIATNSKDFETYTDEIELEDLQKTVGGYIEVIHLQSSIMIVNEDGRIDCLPSNPLASNIAGFPIVGDAVLLTAESMEKLK